MKVVVLGADLDGLVATAVLQRAGHRVTLVEPSGITGAASTLLRDTSWVSPRALTAAGVSVPWRDPEPVHAPGGVRQLPSSVLTDLVDGLRPLVHTVLGQDPPDPGDDASPWPWARRALDLRRLGADRMMQLLRIAPTSLLDTMNALYDDPVQQGLRMPPALLGTWMGPMSPTSTAPLLLLEAARGQAVEGGTRALITALEAVCPEPLQAAPVSIPIERGAVTGIRLQDGTELEAEVVLSCLGPRRTLLDLVSPRHLDPGIVASVRDIRVRGIHAHARVRLREPCFEATHVRIGRPLDLERAFDDAKHRRLPRAPGLDVWQDGSTLSVLVYGAAHALEGGWTTHAREALQERILTVLASAAPGVSEAVEEVSLTTPADLETHLGLDGGHLLQGEVALDQLWSMRPTPQLCRGDAGVDGLVLGGPGMHPGIPHTGIPGWLAARRVMAR